MLKFIYVQEENGKRPTISLHFIERAYELDLAISAVPDPGQLIKQSHFLKFFHSFRQFSNIPIICEDFYRAYDFAFLISKGTDPRRYSEPMTGFVVQINFCFSLFTILHTLMCRAQVFGTENCSVRVDMDQQVVATTYPDGLIGGESGDSLGCPVPE